MCMIFTQKLSRIKTLPFRNYPTRSKVPQNHIVHNDMFSALQWCILLNLVLNWTFQPSLPKDLLIWWDCCFDVVFWSTIYCRCKSVPLVFYVNSIVHKETYSLTPLNFSCTYIRIRSDRVQHIQTYSRQTKRIYRGIWYVTSSFCISEIFAEGSREYHDSEQVAYTSTMYFGKLLL